MKSCNGGYKCWEHKKLQANRYFLCFHAGKHHQSTCSCIFCLLYPHYIIMDKGPITMTDLEILVWVWFWDLCSLVPRLSPHFIIFVRGEPGNEAGGLVWYGMNWEW